MRDLIAARGSEGSDFAFKILVDQLAIAIGAFDPAVFARDLQPDARVTQSAFAAITGDPIAVHDLGFWGGGAHLGVSFWLLMI